MIMYAYRRCCLLIILIGCFRTRSIHAENVTFIPRPIHITIADLPRPFATVSANNYVNITDIPLNPRIFVPNGFTVTTWMSDVSRPRLLLLTPTGDVLVSESREDRISCLVDNNNDGYPDERLTFANRSNKLDRPYGMAFHDAYFYVANRNGIRRYSWTNGSRQIIGDGELVMTIAPTGHWTRSLLLSPVDKKMFVGIGSLTDHDRDPMPRASIQTADLDGNNQTTFAYGLRNPTAIAIHPITRDLYVACQERDEIGDDLVPDFFTRIQYDDFFGWPLSYLSSNLIDPRYQFDNGSSVEPDLVSRTKTPDVLFQAHSAVLDIHFYTGQQFPKQYRQGAFAALHGSWNRLNATGYKIVFIPFNDNHRPKGYYEDFVHGFLTDHVEPLAFARPVGLLVLQDGSLLFTDDGNNRIYRVQYTGIISMSMSHCISIALVIMSQIYVIVDTLQYTTIVH
jgi:glucose/arabinose dehydrogenase